MMIGESAFGLFETDAGAVAIAADCLVQVLEGSLRRRLPGAPQLIPGVVEFQERLVPLVDLQLDGSAQTAADMPPLVVVCITRRGPVGFPVRRVRQVAPFSAGVFEVSDAVDGKPWQTGTFQFKNEIFQVIDIDYLVEVLPG